MQVFACVAICCCAVSLFSVCIVMQTLIKRMGFLEDVVKFRQTRCTVCCMVLPTHDLEKHIELERAIQAYRESR
jgi:hypothetical protein